MISNEFPHVHPAKDGDLHTMLPEDAVSKVIDLGWAELHPTVAADMIP